MYGGFWGSGIVIGIDLMRGEKIFHRLKTTNDFFNASFVYIVANGIGQGTMLLANIFFTRYMSQNDYGLYSNYYSYVAILVPFVGLNLYFGLMNAYMDYKEEIHKLRSSVLMLSFGGLFITGAVVFAISITAGLTMPVLCIILALAHAYGFFLVNFYIQSMNMENRFIAKGVMLAVPNVLQALLAGIAVLISNTFISRAVGATAGVLSCGLVAVILILKEAKPVVNFEYWKYVLRISLPAIIGSVSAMIMQQCDKVMITSLRNAEETAVYSLIYNIGYILYAVQQATNGAWQAWLYNTMDGKRYENIKAVQKWYMFFMLVLATGLYMIAPEIVKILSPKSYWHYDYVIPFIIGSYLMLMYHMNMGVIQYWKRTDVVSAIVAIAAIINIAFNYALIPQFGGIGAAYTSVFSYLFIFIANTIYVRINGEEYFKLSYYIVNVVIVVLLGVVFHYTINDILARYVVFALIIAAETIYIFVKKDEVRSLFGGRIFENE